MSSTVRTRLQELTAPASGDVTMPVDFSRRRLAISRPAMVVIVLLAVLVMGVAGMAGSKVTQPEVAVVPDPSVAAIADDAASGPAGSSVSSSADSAANNAANSAAQSSVATPVVVSVVGLVKKPGVVTLPTGSRVADAVEAAGGFSAKANPASVNLARLVSDGEQIVVTDQVDPAANSGGVGTANSTTSGTTSGTSSGSTNGTAESATGGKVNVNTASETELETLPGIGPATAAAIVAFRQDNGPFTSVAQLGEVPGIGPKKLERISGSVTV
ncbi:ComEA family DNA-binding protein [Corynebacterium ulceribovis]|uniref:ComEA family DNA-binding protein n=1 Tax=Corynebacterium ulceribovis TaxID=487732 RepID=UPI0003A3D415|nr:ComEA family DNA-binding protein [Corynebacterium ulceribovis]